MPTSVRYPWRRPRGQATPPNSALQSVLAVGVAQIFEVFAEPQLAIYWPWIAETLRLSAIGTSLLQCVLYFGYWVGTICGTRVVIRYGQRSTLIAGALALYVSYPLIVAIDRVPSVSAFLLVAGIGNGLYAVTMRVVASSRERDAVRRHTLAFRGVASVTEACSALLGATVLAIHLEPAFHLGLIAVVVLSCLLPVLILAPGDALTRRPQQRTVRSGTTALARNTRPLATMSAMAVIAITVVFTQGGLILTRFGVSETRSADALVAFLLGQAIVQLSAWSLSARVSTSRIVSVGVGIGATGALLVALACCGLCPAQLVLAAFACAGVGVAPVIPATYAAAGRLFPAIHTAAVGHIVAITFLAAAAAPLLVLGSTALVGSTLGPCSVFAGALIALTICVVAFHQQFSPAQRILPTPNPPRAKP